MPFLLIFLKLGPTTAVLTSLMIQTAGMGSGTLAYWRQKQIDLPLAGLLLLLTLPGIAFGTWMTRLVSPPHLELTLGLLTLVTAFFFVSGNQNYADAGISRADLKRVSRHGWLVSLMSIASGMLSISIGEWVVPLMRKKWSLQMGVAVATSIAAIFGVCVLGSLFHLSIGARADLSTIGWAVPGVIIGGQIGPRLAEKINDRVLKEVFIFLLTLIGIHLIYNSY